MNKQVVLITGASKGLGKALAYALCAQGHIVYSGVRDIHAAPEGTIPLLLDVTIDSQRQAAIQTIIATEQKIDILIHNAAIAYYGAAESMTYDEVTRLFETNFFGAFRLTQLAVPHMRTQNSSRILFISSIRGTESCAYMGMYAASKAALEAMALDWAITLRKWNILVSVVQPGPIDTNIDIKHGTFFDQEQQNPYLPYPKVNLELQPTSEVCDAIIAQLQNPFPPFRFQTSHSSEKTIAFHLNDPTGNQWMDSEIKRILT